MTGRSDSLERTGIEENSAATSAAPPVEAVRTQLSRILATSGFSRSPRLRAFLSYVIEESLAGRAEHLKEITLGQAVFDNEDFDPNQASVVRTTASRVRSALETYYNTDGISDEILIDLPTGGYVPHFRLRIENPIVLPPSAPAADLPAAAPSQISFWLWGGPVLLVLLMAGVWLLWSARNPVPSPTSSPIRPRRLLAGATSEGQSLKRIEMGRQYRQLLMTPDERKLYAISLTDSFVTVLGVKDLQVKRTVRLPRPDYNAFMTRDGRRIYISSRTGGVMVLDTSSDRLEPIIPTTDPAFDVAVTPDDRKLFLAMGNRGLARIDLKTNQRRVISSITWPRDLDIDRSGKRLFVAYQSGGPQGRPGHDAVDIYDVDSEQSVWTIKDLAMVGNPPLFAAEDEVVLLDMRDACVSPQYDHVGCQAVPSWGFYLWRPRDRKVIATHAVSERQQWRLGGTFFSHGTRIAQFVAGDIVIWDWARSRDMERLHLPDIGQAVVISPSEDRAFIALGGVGGLLALKAEKETCLPPATGLKNFYPGDGTRDDFEGNGSLTMSGTVEFLPGRIGQAFHFNGAQFLKGLNNSCFCPYCGEPWSVSFFAKFDSMTGEMTLLNRDDKEGAWDFTIGRSSDRHIVLRGRGQERTIVSSAPVTTDRWYHVAMVTGKTSRSLYVDAVLQGQSPRSQKVLPMGGQNPQAMFIGATQGARDFFKGLIDELAVYNRALSPSELKAMASPCNERKP